MPRLYARTQGESHAFMADGASYLTISEGQRASVHHFLVGRQCRVNR